MIQKQVLMNIFADNYNYEYIYTKPLKEHSCIQLFFHYFNSFNLAQHLLQYVLIEYSNNIYSERAFLNPIRYYVNRKEKLVWKKIILVKFF